MNLAYTILYVESVKETLAFYEAGFGFKTKMIHESGDYGELETGSTVLAFLSYDALREMGKDPAKHSAKNPSFEIAFTTDDVADAVKTACAAGAELIQGASDMPWGQTIAYVADNNGFLVELCTPMG